MSNPVCASRLKAGERFQVAGLEYSMVSVTINGDGPEAAIRIDAVRPDGTGQLYWYLRGDDWVTLTHRIPDEW